MDSAWREDYFNFGGTVKAYFCNKPKPTFETTSPENNFVLDQVRKINRNNSNIKRNNSNIIQQRQNIYNRKRKDDHIKSVPNDEKFYIPKEPSQQLISKNKAFSANIENLNKVFERTTIEDKSSKFDNTFDTDTKYFDSLSPFGDNQDYIEKLQQDIRDLRNEYAEKSRQSPNLSNYRNQFNFDTSKLRSSSQKDEDRREYFTPPSQEIENLVQRSFWDDLAKMKQKIVKKKQVSSTKPKEPEECDTRDVWYRTSRRYSDSRLNLRKDIQYLFFLKRIRRSMKKKSRDKTVTKIKSSSWSHNPSARKDLQIRIKEKTPPSLSCIPSKHHPNRQFLVPEDIRLDKSDLAKDVYKEILDIVNVNSPNAPSFGKARMAQWVLSSKPYQSEDV